MGRFILAGLLAVALVTPMVAQDRAPNRREVTIVGENFRFAPDRIEVSENDLVKVTLHSVSEPFSFAIDTYRIAKRTAAGKTISFEFRADQPGTFEFYCNLSAETRCADMRGTLVVNAR